MELIISAVILFVVIGIVSYENIKLRKKIVSLYGMINGLKVENNILENRLELLEGLEDV